MIEEERAEYFGLLLYFNSKLEIDDIIKPKIENIKQVNKELLNTINTVNSNFKELEKQQEQLKQGIKELERIIKKEK